VTAALENGTNTEMEEYKKELQRSCSDSKEEMRWKAQGSLKMEKNFVFLNHSYKFNISVRIVKHKKDCITTMVSTFG
jgi:hypothetical protein